MSLLDREAVPGTVIWITGLSGAGKSTIARRTHELLKAAKPNVVLLDGDAFRAIIGDDLRHNSNDRLLNAYRIARFCKFLSDQGIDVVCATMSLFDECHEWNRQNIRRYFEVYLRVTFEVVVKRDPKGLYKRARQGLESGVVGVDLPFHEPKQPHLVIDNSSDLSTFDDIAQYVIKAAFVGQPLPE